ncbi:MAG TPA: PLP-dependent aspartate aminotransferase family protein [Aestuariivirgaceae bacterium]|jgi:cystathionine gamma-synthase
MSSANDKPDARTRVAQGGHFIDPLTGAVIPPLQLATTFARNADYELIGSYIYSRNGTPTADHAEKLMAELEGAAQSLLFASGMAAVAALIDTLETGQRIAAPDIMYHGVKTWMLRQQKKRGIGLDLFDASNAAQSLHTAVIPGKTALVWIETPTNPTWHIIDIRRAAEVAHDAGAILAVDSTCAPPVTTRPLQLGADIVFHSATKYLNGHSDVTAGALSTSTIDNRWNEINSLRVSLGSIIAPFEAWLLLRGMRTLYLRYAEASANALALAQHFEKHPKLERVLYPGLKSHPGHEIARRQMTGGFGGMMSIAVKGDGAIARRVTSGLRVFLPATSLGGVESLAEHRRSVEGPNSIVPENLIRLSIGIEAASDLIADLEQALEAV